MSFLPPNYTVPVSGGQYMKFKQGNNTFRILGDSIVGYEYWVGDEGNRKPVRVHKAREISTADVDPKDIKHFWAFPVWNYTDEKVQILEITQSTIQTAITELDQNEDWGNIFEYDITVNKTGESMETRYSILPKPKKDMPKEAHMDWLEVQKNGFDLNELFTSGDPFNPKKNDEINVDDIEL
jgi:hypothetical protein